MKFLLMFCILAALPLAFVMVGGLILSSWLEAQAALDAANEAERRVKQILAEVDD